MEVRASKEELIAFQAKATAEIEVLEAEFDASSDMIFNYGYGCCAFVHDICIRKPMIPVGMLDTSKPLPPEFFVKPRCPPSASPGPPGVAAGREEPPDLSPSAAVDGTDTLLEPSVGYEG